MELVIPARSMDFDFNGARSSPVYLSTPSTPKRFGEYFFGSAPTSPTRISEFYHEFDHFLINNGNNNKTKGPHSKSPLEWEEKPGTPKSSKAAAAARDEDDFAFDFSAELEKASLSADELFDEGKIRPLKPPPRLQLGGIDDSVTQKSSPKSPRSSIAQGKKIIRDAFSPRRKKNQDPFATAVENTSKKSEHERGRDRTPALSSSNSGRRETRSLSPLRVNPEYPWEEEQQLQQNTKQLSPVSKPSLSSTASTLSSSSKGSFWRLRDFLLFRSASEGRATDKDPFRKYAAFKKQEDVKNASFRSTDSSGSGSSKRRSSRGPVSAHELHYTMNKAVSEDLKKKTFLPYKQGILGRLAFNPAVHALANGFGLARS